MKLNIRSKFRKIFAAIAVACLTVASATTAGAFNASMYPAHSKMASGKWVKIKIPHTGVFQISYDQLKEWGFPEPEKVKVYGWGGSTISIGIFEQNMPSDIRRTYCLHRNDKLIFYGRDVVWGRLNSKTEVISTRNFYSSTTTYLLSDIPEDPTDMNPNAPYVERTHTKAPYSSHLAMQYKEQDLIHPANGGGIFLGQTMEKGDEIPFDFEVYNFDPGNTKWNKAAVRIAFGANTSQTLPIYVRLPKDLEVDNVQSASTYAQALADGDTRQFTTGRTTVTFTDTLKDGIHTFSAVAPDKDFKFMALDYAWMLYPRRNKLEPSRGWMEMYFYNADNSMNFTLVCPPQTRVINTTHAYDTREQELQYDASTGIATGSFHRNYLGNTYPNAQLVAFDPDFTFPTVEYVSDVPNQDLHGIPTPDMLILTTRSLLPAAEELAEIHRKYDAMDVAVVVHDLTFNEFSSSTPEIMGYRRFIKMLYDRNPSKLKHILLYGPSTWDNRSILTAPGDNLLVFECTESSAGADISRNYANDAVLGMVEDYFDISGVGRTEMAIAVGRIPVPTLAQARAVNAKIEKYIRNVTSNPTYYGKAIVIADDGDKLLHVTQAEAFVDTLVAVQPAIVPYKAYNHIFPWDGARASYLNEAVTQNLKQGTGLFCYIGHGTPEVFADQKLWSKNLVMNTHYDVPPLAMLATCCSYSFDLNDNGIAENMLYKEDGGMIALIAAGRTVRATANQQLALEVARAYATAGQGATLGDVWRNARKATIKLKDANSELFMNTMCYNLCGDPALRLPTPGHRVELTTVDGQTVAPDAHINLTPWRPVQIAGRIIDSAGNVDTHFNGTVTVRVMDGQHQATMYQRDYGDTGAEDFPVEIWHDELVSRTYNVENGLFTGTLATPVPLYESSQPNTVTLMATDGNNTHAAGTADGIYIAAASDPESPTTFPAPSITELDVTTGDTAENWNTATIDAHGLVSDLGLMTSDAPGAKCTLTLDGKNALYSGVKLPITQEAAGTWNLNMELAELTEGTHTVTLSIADNAGQRTHSTANFIVTRAALPATLTADRATVRDEVELDLDHPFASTDSVDLVLEDAHGSHITTIVNPAFPYTLDMAALNLKDGHYNAYARVKSGSENTSTRKIQLVYITR